MNTRAAMTGAVLVGLVAGSAAAQAINFDCWLPGSVPSSSYGAGSGQAGTWNAAGQTVIYDASGNQTTVTVSAAGGGPGTAPVAGAAPDNAALMDDYRYIPFSGGELDVGNLAQGKYRVYVYMWQGAITQSAGQSRIRVGANGDKPSNVVLTTNYSKDWPGQQVLGNTYTYTDLELSGTQTIIFAPAFPSDFCIIQGFQLVPIPGPASLAAFAPLGLVAARRKRSR